MDRGTIRMPDDAPEAPKFNRKTRSYTSSVGIGAFNLRLPPALRAQLDEVAAANHRSLNAEIVHRLKLSFESYRV